MTSAKYIGMDVHKESISIAVRNSVGKVVMECVIETKASMIVQFIDGLRGDLQVTFEEGTSAAWLYDLLKPHVTKLVVCDPRKNKSMREGNQNDKIDARRLAELLRLDHLTPVYHGEHGLYAEGVGAQLSDHHQRPRTGDDTGESHLSKLGHPLYRQAGVCAAPSCRVARKDQRTRSAPALDALRVLRQEARRDLLAESKKHQAWKRLCEIPSIGPIRAAVLLGILQTPHRFRSKRPLWNYGGLAIEMHSSADHRSVDGQLQRSRKNVLVRGLNRNCNHDLKNLFKGAAAVASSKPDPFQEFYTTLVAKGMRPEMARLTLARKIATIVLIVWKKGVCFDANHLKPQTA